MEMAAEIEDLAALQEGKSPMDVFRQFVTDELVMRMVTETNRKAEQKLESSRVLRSQRVTRWSQTDHREMCKFIGLIMWMGLVRYP
jgi:Transposase IS4